MGWTVLDLNPGTDEGFIFSLILSDRLWGSTYPFFIQWLRGSFPGGELNHSHLSSANAKNEWCYTPSPSIYFHGEYR